MHNHLNWYHVWPFDCCNLHWSLLLVPVTNAWGLWRSMNGWISASIPLCALSLAGRRGDTRWDIFFPRPMASCFLPNLCGKHLFSMLVSKEYIPTKCIWYILPWGPTQSYLHYLIGQIANRISKGLPEKNAWSRCGTTTGIIVKNNGFQIELRDDCSLLSHWNLNRFSMWKYPKKYSVQLHVATFCFGLLRSPNCLQWPPDPMQICISQTFSKSFCRGNWGDAADTYIDHRLFPFHGKGHKGLLDFHATLMATIRLDVPWSKVSSCSRLRTVCHGDCVPRKWPLAKPRRMEKDGRGLSLLPCRSQ